ncbi:hypothetical protein SIN8267_00430 [Sinobacterium norvegicum]|uniref:DNA replication terminus site-binding protein n=1 Tax=Sinobacterium norvegicum TaxID=1641715 RepID=A0ABN8EFC5_9GAMM|nr:DNA replication terminus site-binding protein [Sinobacterium norvegicum]CAH0990338.1 hypothetical protein SIN8267_00430 [Sinobacterium norvegicum]
MQKLSQCFDDLIQSNNELNLAIESNDSAGWVCGNTGDIQQALQAAYSDYWYTGDGDGRKTKNYHGLYLADDRTVACAIDVNAMKSSFKHAVQQIQKEDKQQWLLEYGMINNRYREQLTTAQLSRLNLKQTYRHIPILNTSPAKIGFSWYTQGKSITRVSKQQAYDRLAKFGDSSHIRIQQQKLATLNDYEKLAIVQKQAPLVRANIVYQQGTEIIRKATNSSLPFIIADTHHGRLPEFNQINELPPQTHTRLRRSDSKISDDVFLPSIRAYRYI